ncbi:hypothetical protein LQW54_010647 [Pestalotiopsis sp. IQ-011]
MKTEYFRFEDLPPEIRNLIYEFASADPAGTINLHYMGPLHHLGAPLWLQKRLAPVTSLMRFAMVDRLIYREFFPYYEAYLARNAHLVDMDELDLYVQSSLFARHTAERLLINVDEWFSRDVDVIAFLRSVWCRPTYHCQFVTKNPSPSVRATVVDLNKLLAVKGRLRQCSKDGTLDAIHIRWRGYTMFATMVRTGHNKKNVLATPSLHVDLAWNLGISRLRDIAWRATTLEDSDDHITEL